MQNFAINFVEDICPISEFRGEINNKLTQTKSTHRPIILTQHGKSTAVVLDIHDFQAMQNRLEFLEEYRLAKMDIESGKTFTTEEAKSRVNGKLDAL